MVPLRHCGRHWEQEHGLSWPDSPPETVHRWTGTSCWAASLACDHEGQEAFLIGLGPDWSEGRDVIRVAGLERFQGADIRRPDRHGLGPRAKDVLS